MDSIVARGESHDRAASEFKLGSLVQIDSIAIEISTGAMEEMELQTHDHFSIRGFVAGMRKKNLKTCLPFASENDDANPTNYLPSIHVPRFRWWQCSNCVPDIGVKSSEEIVETGISEVGTSSCQNTGEETGLVLHGSKEQANVTDKEAGILCGEPIGNPLPIRQGHSNTTEMVCISEHPSSINDKPGDEPLVNDGNFSALSHRKKPKLRSLADILVEEKNPIDENPKTMQIISTETEDVLGPRIELDVPDDVAKDSRSPERKRKIALEEDRGALGVIIPKKTRGPTLDAEKKCKRVEISDTESERDASLRMAQRTKPKRNEALDIRKKTKQTRAENRREIPKISVKCSANLQKRDVSHETSFDKLGAIGSYFRGIMSGQQILRFSNGCDKRPEFEACDDHTVMTNNGKGFLDLSLDSYRSVDRNYESEAWFVQHRGIPDLNVEFRQKTAETHEKQFCVFPEKNLPHQKNLFFQDVSTSTSKQKFKEGKNKSGLAKTRKTDRNLDLGSSDDIPMEIVELLAKNQHERALGNPSKNINNSPTTNVPPANVRNGLTVSNKKTGFGQNNISLNFPPLRKSQPDPAKPDESQFRLLTSSTLSQHRKKGQPFPMSSSTNLVWPPMRENVSPSHLSTGVHSFSRQSQKGKTICDLKAGPEKRYMLKEGMNISGSKSIGSSDPYLNDTIPAMQLLSLMDQQVVSSSSVLGKHSFLDTPFSPCTHQARLNGKENHNVLGGSFFPQNSHYKGFSGLAYGVYSSGESSKNVPSYLQGQVTLELGNSKANPLKGSSSLLMVRPARRDLAMGVCRLNRNPADFSIPDVRNEFTISGKDLKPKNHNVSKEKSQKVNGEQRKRKSLKKDELC